MGKICWAVQPGQGIGPFNLGDQINKVLEIITNATFLNSPAKVNFSTSEPYTNDMEICFVDSHLRLCFDKVTQRLCHILMSPYDGALAAVSSTWTSYSLSYDGHIFSSSDAVPDCRRIVATFPPTRLGVYEESDLTYSMKFDSGVEFLFSISDEKTFASFVKRRDHPITVNEYSPVVSRMRIFNDGKDFSTVDLLPRFELYPLDGVACIVGNSPSEVNSMYVKLNSGPQDIMSALGPPENIHNGIYNYYRYGIDIKTEDTDNFSLISKIILRTNLPGHPLFGKYTRCWFQIIAGKKKSGTAINNYSTLTGIVDILGNPGQPLVVSNDSSKCVQYFYTFPNGLCIETNSHGFVASIQLSGRDL